MPILPPDPLLEACETPPLTGDPAADLVAIEAGRLCAEGRLAALRQWKRDLQAAP